MGKKTRKMKQVFWTNRKQNERS